MNTEKPLTYLLGQTFNLVKLKLIESFRENLIDISLEQYFMLNLIRNNADLTQQDLANHFQRDKSLILRYVNALLAANLVTRSTDSSDKRKKNLVLTAHGEALLAKMRTVAKAVSDELLGDVSEQEKQVFVTVIQKIQKNTGQTDRLMKNRQKIENKKV